MGAMREIVGKNKKGLSNTDAYFLKIKWSFLEEKCVGFVGNPSCLVISMITPWKYYLKKKLMMSEILGDWNLLFSHGHYMGFDYIFWFWSNIYAKG